jgi:Raf kinase inhibitor-like YbhB/YbcL family protein
MLEHVPQWLGHALRGLRAGAGKLCILQPALGGSFAPIQLSSPAFADGGRLPPRFTADGEGISPPLVWGPVPEGTRCLALIVEDPDAPSLEPLVHAIVWGITADVHRLEEGAIRRDGKGSNGKDVGRNSLFLEGWLPPDPPTGHGDHHYAFQLFALGDDCGDPGTNPRRGSMVKVMRGKVLAAGLLTGVYSRGEPAMIGRAPAKAGTGRVRTTGR